MLSFQEEAVSLCRECVKRHTCVDIAWQEIIEQDVSCDDYELDTREDDRRDAAMEGK